jgi:hypothetical protein
VLSHPSDKNKGVARVGHASSVAIQKGLINKTNSVSASGNCKTILLSVEIWKAGLPDLKGLASSGNYEIVKKPS